MCVLTWSGEIIHTLSAAELGLNSTDFGGGISPVQEGMFLFWVGSVDLTHRIFTYKVGIPYLLSTFLIVV